MRFGFCCSSLSICHIPAPAARTMMLVSAMSTNDLFQSASQNEQMKGGRKRDGNGAATLGESAGSIIERS